MKKIILIALSIFVFSACSTETSLDDGKLKVVATTGMIADVVENIGGEFINVESLMGPGVDPHLYTPTASDISTLEGADVIFYNGLHLEGKMIEIFEAFEEEGREVHAIAESLDEERFIVNEDFVGAHDPHIWFDVMIWADSAEVIAEALEDFDSENALSYSANYEAYRLQLEQLDQWVRDEIASIPEQKRILITAHDAFAYFGQAYGLEVMGIQGVSTDADYGLKDLEDLIDIIVERDVKAIFVESSVSPKSIEALKAGVEAEGKVLEIGGELFSDAMGEPDTVEGTYLGMFEHNVSTIVNALK